MIVDLTPRFFSPHRFRFGLNSVVQPTNWTSCHHCSNTYYFPPRSLLLLHTRLTQHNDYHYVWFIGETSYYIWSTVANSLVPGVGQPACCVLAGPRELLARDWAFVSRANVPPINCLIYVDSVARLWRGEQRAFVLACVTFVPWLLLSLEGIIFGFDSLVENISNEIIALMKTYTIYQINKIINRVLNRICLTIRSCQYRKNLW